MQLLLAIIGCCTLGANGQFQLFFGSQAPPVPSGGVDPNCIDKINTCDRFEKSSCVAPYEGWARTNCPNYCGYCKGPTTPPPACIDTITNCEDYGHDMCTKSEFTRWAHTNCRRYCRMCAASALARLVTTTISPADCVDKVDCKSYGADACSATFKPWAMENCAYHCKYCIGLPPTEPPCLDRLTNCYAYTTSDCSNNVNWAEANCRSRCGMCNTAIRTPPPAGSGSGGIAYPSPPMPMPGK